MLQSIEIAAPPEKIFDYISDLRNDPKWRPEVTKMEMLGEKEVGVAVLEYITIYRFFHFLTPTYIKVLHRPFTFVAETPDTHPTWVQCIRSTQIVANGKTKFTVRLSFTLDNIKQISPIIPPGFVVKAWYTLRIKNYLKNLKQILETA
jgi:hypothetical protein